MCPVILTARSDFQVTFVSGESMPLAMCRFGEDGKLLTANAAARELLSLDGDGELTLREVFSDGREFEQFSSALRRDGRATETVRMNTRSGVTSGELRAAALPDGKIELAVIDRGSHGGSLFPLDALINNTPAVAIEIFDRNGRVKVWNPAAEGMHGYSAAEMIGRTIQERLTPEEVQRFEHEVNRICETGEPMLPDEWEVRHRDGTMRHVYSSMFPLEIDGETMVCCMDVDMTERRRAEKALAEREARLQMLLRQLPAVLWTTDRELRVTSLSGSALAAFGIEPDAIIGRRADVCLAELGGDIDRARRIHEAAFEGTTSTHERVWRGRTFRIHIEPFHGDRGENIGAIALAFDITERRHAEERFRAMVEHSYDGITTVDQYGTIIYTGPSTERLIGYTESEVTGGKVIDFVHPDDRERTRETFVNILKVPRDSVVTQYRVLHRDGSVHWFEGVFTNLIDEPTVGAVVTNYRDITERKESEIQMAYQAYHDALTDLPNRMLFSTRLAMALSHARRTHDTLAVLFLDLDQFKLINDTLGHTVGDRLLQGVARRLESSVRIEDSLSRVGGDEFTLLLQGCNDPQDAAQVAEKLIALLNDPFDVDGHQLYVSGSIGVSFYPTDGETAEALIKAADTAMYRAKELGRHGVQLFKPEINEKYRERLSMETSLRQALEQEEFVLHYQPLFDRISKKVVAVEALIRWIHPTRGMVSPMEFIPVAEETRIILPIGEWVLRRACTDVMEWRRVHHQTLRLAVNLSARQFHHAALLETIDRILAETGFDPQALEIEITETIAMLDAEHSLRTLWELKRRGITIAIDDFGTGQTSLTYLTRFPIDTVKIDRAFVENVASDTSDAAIVSAVIALSQRLRMKVVAEGVETEEQLQFLSDQGCDQIQGFLLSRPLSSEALSLLLQGPGLAR